MEYNCNGIECFLFNKAALQIRRTSLSSPTCSSLDKLVVVFEFHDEWSDVFAVALPLLDALFGVGVEVLRLVVKQGLGSLSLFLLISKFVHLLLVFNSSLSLVECGKFLHSNAFFFFLLLLS